MRIFIILLTIAILIITAAAFAGVQPIATYKDNLISTFSSATSTSVQSPLPISSSPKTTPLNQSKMLGMWNYTISDVIWIGNKVSMNIDVTNNSNKVLPFSAGNELSLTTDNKLCLVDSFKQIYWSKNDGEGIRYFYNQQYYPTEKKSGRLEFTVNSHSGDCYLYLYWASNPRNQLLSLGSPR